MKFEHDVHLRNKDIERHVISRRLPHGEELRVWTCCYNFSAQNPGCVYFDGPHLTATEGRKVKEDGGKIPLGKRLPPPECRCGRYTCECFERPTELEIVWGLGVGAANVSAANVPANLWDNYVRVL